MSTQSKVVGVTHGYADWPAIDIVLIELRLIVPAGGRPAQN